METLEERILRALTDGSKSIETLLTELETTEPELTEALDTLKAAKHVQQIGELVSLLPML